MIRRLFRLESGKILNVAKPVIRRAIVWTNSDSCLRWTPSFYEKNRTGHIPAPWNRRYDADEPGRPRLDTRNRKADKTREHFLVRRFRARKCIPDRGIVKAERADQVE